jgi:DNA-binding response OmpR family regulator
MDFIYIVTDDTVRGNLVYTFLAGRLKCALVKPHEYFQLAQKENPMVYLFLSNNYEWLKSSITEVRESSKFYNSGIICVYDNPSIQQQKELFEYGSDMVISAHTEMERIYLECYSLIRRMNGFHNSSVVQFGPYIVDFLKNEIQKDGKFYELEPIQTRIIKLFFEHADQLLTRKHLKDVVWKDQEISPRSIDAQISKLKKKFPELNDMIQSVYGQGYIIRTHPNQKVS